jgi:Flp pilus assembly protein TadB
MINRTSDAIPFLTMLAVGFAGAVGATWWVAALGALALLLVSWRDRLGATSRFGEAIPARVRIVAGSVNGAAFSAAAFSIGIATTWIWGT